MIPDLHEAPSSPRGLRPVVIFTTSTVGTHMPSDSLTVSVHRMPRAWVVPSRNGWKYRPWK
eukprot:1036513-Pyramimonas_sp.AAC.1